MRRARTGDRRAYEELLRKLIPILKPYFIRRAGDHQNEADDFVQDCLIAIHQRQITYSAARPLLPWVCDPPCHTSQTRVFGRNKATTKERTASSTRPGNPIRPIVQMSAPVRRNTVIPEMALTAP